MTNLDPAEALRELNATRHKVQGYIRSGGMLDLLIVLWARTPAAIYERVERVRLSDALVTFCFVALAAAFGVYYLRRRRGLGARIEWPTWAFAALSFAATLVVSLTVTNSHTRDGLEAIVMGVAVGGIAIAYRHVLLGFVPMLDVGGLHLLFGGPVILYFIPALVYAGIAAYVGRATVRRAGSMIARDLRRTRK